MKTLVVCALFISLLCLRAPDLFPPRLWAEDGNLFLVAWYAQGLISFVTPYAGYWHFVPRLTAAISDLLPQLWTLWWFTIVSVAMATWSASILFRTLGGGFAGVIAAAALLLAPGWQETLGTVTNLQWVMAPALLTLVMNPAALSRSEGLAFAILAGLSGPFSALFLPISGIVLLWSAYNRKPDWVALVAVAAGLLQIGALLTTVASTPPVEAPQPQWLAGRILELSLSLSAFPVVAAVVALALSLLAGEKRLFRLGLLAALVLVTVAVVAKWSTNFSVFESGQAGLRYWYIQGSLWLIMGASIISERARWLKVSGLVSLCLILSNIHTKPFIREWNWPADQWETFVRAARNGPAKYKYAPNWTMTLDFSK